MKMTLLYGKQANLENQLGPVHGVKVDQDGTLSVQLWPGKLNTHFIYMQAYLLFTLNFK